MMKFNCKKIACLVGGIVILGAAGLSAGCHAQEPQVQVPVQGVCESPHGGPITPIFQDVKQIYLLWDYKAEQPELLSEPLREEALKKEVLAYMQTYLTPCSKSKEIKVIRRYDNDNSVVRDERNLIAYAFIVQNAEIDKKNYDIRKVTYLNTVTFRGGFYRAGTYMTSGDVFSIAHDSTKIEGRADGLNRRVNSAISSQLRIRGEIH
ncbi:MAG: hypothetical protein HYS17_09405 [Micavibrio aeruginosavorus]|uniref:LPS export ABC transporter periplasmic protein LptC n=1 Tax=Micavibrio aeruginosavorus TaxID=349221 RepID=A0A7T5UGB8_9BACT|nr:MAG: hypothetical protein HYS17_09405 [Micavibrio aeruginosavorus]